MKILVIRFSSIGDIVLISPVLRCLKTSYPNAEIHFLTKKKFSFIQEANPYINKHHLLTDNNKRELLHQLRSENFDFIADLHNSLRSRQFRLTLRRPGASFPKLNFQKFLLTRFKINRMPEVHVVDRYFNAVAPLGVKNDQGGLDYFIPPAVIQNFRLPASLTPGNFIAFAIGGTYYTKRLPDEMITDICRRSNLPVVLLGGREDGATGEKIATLAGRNKIINTCGSLSLHESAVIVKEARSVITHDTGMMHIAAAFKKKIISVWGNTVPDFGMYPYLAAEESYMAEVRDLPCRPCSKLGYNDCPLKHFNCMRLQETDTIIAKAEV